MFTWWQGILAVIATIVIYLIVVFVSSHTGGVQVRLDGTLLPLGIVGQDSHDIRLPQPVGRMDYS